MYLNYADPENIDDVVTAIRDGDMVTLRFALKDGMDPDTKDRHGLGLLHYAAMEGRTEAVEALLRAGADAELPVATTSHTPLFYAARNRGAETIELLARYGAKLGAVDGFGYTPLHMAAAHGCYEAVKALLAAGADAGAKTKKGETPRDLAWRKYESIRQADHWLCCEHLRQAELQLGLEGLEHEKAERDIARLKAHNPKRFKLRF